MRVKHLLAAAVVVISSAALVATADAAQRQRYPGGAARSGGGGGGQGGGNQGGGNQANGGGAAPRQGGGGGERRAAPRNNDNGGEGRRDGGGAQAAARPPRQDTSGNSGQRQQANGGQQASPRYAQPRRVPDANTDLRRGTSERFDQGRVGEQPRVAVPRATVTDPRRYNGNWNRNGYRVYKPSYGSHNRHYGYPYYGYARPYYYYPYAFGYGPYGRGSFYFDTYYNSYVFYPPAVARYDYYGSYSGTYGYPTGELKLKVRPNNAQVFIDGAYAGTVDEFDGAFQSLRLEGGDYQVEIVAPGYEPLDFDVRITPGEKTTYQGDLLPERQPQPFAEPPQP
jgi:hypothetical protein